jgi:hypothetical protein
MKMRVVPIVVKWGKYREVVQVDLRGLLEGRGEVIATTESLDGQRWRWKTTSTFDPDDEGAGTLTIFYKRALNGHLDGCWGCAKYHLNREMRRGEVEWIDDTPGNETTVRWNRLSNDTSLLTTRERQSIERLARRQAKLKKLLLMIDPQCAVTREQEPALLEAAHIIPATRGSDIPDNALLLRVDLHRLYDASLIEIDRFGKLRPTSSLRSKEYRALVGRLPSIDPITLERIRPALKHRAAKQKGR